MSDTKLGELITEAGARDAIHVALAPVTANERLTPGQHIGFVREHNTDLVGVSSSPLGIVDPFLERSVERGQRFYMVLYPNTVTGMKHQWEHPAFAPPGTEASIQWLQGLADDIGCDYHSLLSSIEDGYICTGSEDYSGIRDAEDIRRHYENVTGEQAPTDVRFSCAC
jgi:hypothetical protein